MPETAPALRPETAAPDDWADWRWHMRHRVDSADALAAYIETTPDEAAALDATRDVFRWTITPYYASLMDPHDPSCPVRRQVVPRTAELEPDIVGAEDPLEEVAHSPVKNLVHNYRDRVAFCVTAECAIYCRYCLRKRMVGDAEFMMRRDELTEGLAYIAAHPEIRDVLLTGGDPLVFNEAHLAWLFERLRAIPHVEVIRIGSRLPVTLPQRVTPALCDLLRAHAPVWLNTHFNHPKELTPEAAAACARLADAGVPVGNQTVLLRGINDDVDTLRALFEGLLEMRVRPYYLYQAQLIGGTAHFRTSIERGMGLMKQLQGTTTGFAIPKYVLDTPYGKTPLTRDWVLGRAGDRVVMETPRGTLWAEPNPVPEGETATVALPAIALPPEADTLPMDAPTFIVPPQEAKG